MSFCYWKKHLNKNYILSKIAGAQMILRQIFNMPDNEVVLYQQRQIYKTV